MGPRAQVGNDVSNSSGNLVEGPILGCPIRNRLPISRECLEFAESRIRPITRTQDNWNHASFACFMPSERTSQLDVIAIVGSEEVSADEQEHNIRRFYVIINMTLPFDTGCDLPIVPSHDDIVPLERAEMRFEPVSHLLVFVRVAEKELYWFARSCCSCMHNKLRPSVSSWATTEIKNSAELRRASLAPKRQLVTHVAI